MTASEQAFINTTPIVFGAGELRIEDILAVAQGRAQAQLNPTGEWRALIQAGASFLDKLLLDEGVIYGVTTGYGDSCTVAIPLEQVNELPTQLFRFHGCGLGQVFSPLQARAILAVRLTSLARGYSGVSLELLERLALLLNRDIIPVIPEEGSVGASGDLTPLSYIAAVLAGEREVFYQGQRRDTATVYAELGITPLALRPKEGLALMNGTAVMTALACLAHARATQLTRLSARITAMSVQALEGNAYHFDAGLFALKPHPGQSRVADWIRSDLQAEAAPRQADRLQDRYSLRCAPHIIGVLEDSLPWMRQFIETEINSSNDNPLIDPVGERVLHGGHFYGGHIAQAMDALKTLSANIADLLDRQLAQLVDVKFSKGLPRNLTGAVEARLPLNHGFKAVQIAVSAWTAEALKLTMPASVFSRSTECHNQDKVSMGTIAARDALRVLTLTEQCVAALLLANSQALRLRARDGALSLTLLSPGLQKTLAAIAQDFPLLEEDRPLEGALRQLLARLESLSATESLL